MIRHPLLALVLCGLALLAPGVASAQIEAPSRLQEVDPSAVEPDLRDDSSYDPGDQPVEDIPDEPEPPPAQDDDAPPAKATRGAKGGKGAKDVEAVPASSKTPAAPAPVAAPVGPVPPPRPAVSQVLAPRVTDAEVLAVWDRWRQARATNDTASADAALKALVTLRAELVASDLEPLSVGFLRESTVRRRAGDMAGAVRLAELAVQLSPGLPYARFALAEAYALAEPGNVSRYLGEARAAFTGLMGDARYRRPVLADLGALVLLAWAATAAALVGLLFLRRVRYALHDFHHLLPRAVSRWQSALLGLALLALPVALGLGGVAVLLVLLGSVALYLSRAERVVAAVLVAGVGLAPLAAGQLARVTAFAGTPAEDVYLLERGGLSAEAAMARVLARQESRAATFAELDALAHYESRRGLLEEAKTHYKAASALRSGDARLLTRFGNALVGLGDAEGAAQLYVQATQSDPTLAAPHYNLAQVYRRRAKTLPDSEVGQELDRAATAIASAQSLDGSLLGRDPPPEERLLLNLLMLAPSLPEAEWLSLADGTEAGRRVEAQLGRWLLPGVSPGPVAWAAPAALVVLLALWGLAGEKLKAAKVCERCGRAVCVRCDPELGVGSKQCGQCVNVFSRKGLVPQQLRNRKQGQVERHQAWAGRLSYALGAVLSGAGHVASGVPVRGALYAFFFLFALSATLLHHGLVRAPYGDVPLYLKLVPAVLLLVGVHLLSLRGLRRLRRGE
ncbi:tetratricopeptide repeat protein [Pyxidicoccus caerfyrddinensis]|uniref:tetratricopeptide repeat protein n=1 Tax=Pyxidicoccus caerfyrddinensis TaxID=2709663 RepID=UPI0013DD0C7E|nr:tetratricopeptide repeat protein [Pyxidicoccus caerfyrddinensis]